MMTYEPQLQVLDPQAWSLGGFVIADWQPTISVGEETDMNWIKTNHCDVSYEVCEC